MRLVNLIVSKMLIIKKPHLTSSHLIFDNICGSDAPNRMSVQHKPVWCSLRPSSISEGSLETNDPQNFSFAPFKSHVNVTKKKLPQDWYTFPC
jgi:hypothetical protein